MQIFRCENCTEWHYAHENHHHTHEGESHFPPTWIDGISPVNAVLTAHGLTYA